MSTLQVLGQLWSSSRYFWLYIECIPNGLWLPALEHFGVCTTHTVSPGYLSRLGASDIIYQSYNHECENQTEKKKKKGDSEHPGWGKAALWCIWFRDFSGWEGKAQYCQPQTKEVKKGPPCSNCLSLKGPGILWRIYDLDLHGFRLTSIQTVRKLQVPPPPSLFRLPLK